MNEFDPHVAIKELAEVEWPCPDTPERGKAHLGPTCIFCGGLGRIVPFASLRHVTRWVPEPDVQMACWEVSSNSEIMSNVTFNTLVQKWQWYDREGLPSHRGWTSVDRREEAVLRAALAWVQ